MDKFQEVYLESKKKRQAAEFHRYRVQHELHKSEFDGSMIAVPLPSTPIRILDSATGEGTWMIEESERYPHATFVGTDIETAGFEEHSDLPGSISFRQQSILDAWPEADQASFDLVHQRYGFSNIPAEQCQKAVNGLLSLAKPSGYIQLVDTDLMAFESGEGHEGMSEMMSFMGRFFQQGGMNPSSGPKLENWLKAAGAEDVEVRAMSFGMGVRAKTAKLAELSTWNQITLVDNFSFVCSQFPNFWYSPEQFETLAKNVERELGSTGNSWKFWVVTGRRPSNE
ncbi:methyltransferase GliN [Massariosphaeria phaeospora]|uniref:Methyltransferase GliN n=1 Tax=Massariosphaeria phaeospora TaxID=100035 RepID=A0A7C8MVE9_9PLEO|nr:methyltransferase GliN [Massariosphaeria phaeospora]